MTMTNTQLIISNNKKGIVAEKIKNRTVRSFFSCFLYQKVVLLPVDSDLSKNHHIVLTPQLFPRAKVVSKTYQIWLSIIYHGEWTFFLDKKGEIKKVLQGTVL
jgi:hypothetical protein